MIPQANITAWRKFVPWSDDAQVEQDLILSRATCELFLSSELSGKIAMRGGTALHKLVLAESYRYSEDINRRRSNSRDSRRGTGSFGSLVGKATSKSGPWKYDLDLPL